MTQVTFRATRAVPIREQLPMRYYTCQRCGILRIKDKPSAHVTHCRDCRPYVEEEAEP